MIQPFKLGYVVLKVQDLPKVSEYYEFVMGCTLQEVSEDGSRYYSVGNEHYSIILKEARESELSTFSFQIEEDISLSEAQRILKQHGIESDLVTDHEHYLAEALRFQDVDGYTVELFHQMDSNKSGYKREGIAPIKLGHIALGSLHPERATKFYQEVLNFSFTDRIGDKATFLTCNTDHHVLNISNFGERMLHHIAFELIDSSHHVRSADCLAQKDIATFWGPARHTAGHNLASYHHDPEKNVIELYTDMDYYIKQLNMFEARPWHLDNPQIPKIWDHNCVWQTEFEKTILAGVLEKKQWKEEEKA